MKPLVGNVINKEDLRQRMLEITGYVAEVTGKTLGPFGHNALIQNLDRISSSKDGWNTQRKIKFDTILDNAIKSMIESCAFSVVLQAGDGTTTVTLLSYYLTLEIIKLEEQGNYTTKEIETVLTDVVNNLIERVYASAKKITDDNIEDIYNIAMVSTNWDDALSKMICDIYKETKNSIIRIETGKEMETTYEIVEGYELMGQFMCPNYYVNNIDKNTCDLDNPYILLFDYKIPKKYFNHLYYLGHAMATNGRKLVILAPDYEATFINQIEAVNMDAAKKGMPYVNFIPAQYNKLIAIDKECIADFAVLTGAIMVTKQNYDFEDFLDDVYTTATEKPVFPDDATEEEMTKIQEELVQKKTEMINTAILYLDNLCGTCDSISIGEKSIIVKGLSNKNEKLYNERYQKLENEINKAVTTAHALTTLSDNIRQKRIRLGKLKCKMGVIYLSGHGTADLNARRDALEDATRACEAAYRDGYTYGSTISIGNAVSEELIDKGAFPCLEIDILKAIQNSSYMVFRKLFENKLGNTIKDIDNHKIIQDMTISDIYECCCDEFIAYDIIEDKFDTDMNKIINPVTVDVEVLRGCLRLVLTAVTSDQLIFSSFDEDNNIMTDMSQIQTVSESHKPVSEPY